MALGIDPRADVVFKRLFGTEENALVLVHLLESVLGVPNSVVGVDLLPPQSDPAGAQDKQIITDLRARDQGDRQFHLEMQRRWNWALFKRLLLDWALMHPKQKRRGERYETLRPTVTVCILDDTVRLEPFRAVRSHHLEFSLRERTHGIGFSDDLEIHLLVLPWFTKGLEELQTDLDRWCYFLLHAHELDQLPPALDTPILRQAFEVLVMFNVNPDFRHLYDAEERARLMRLSEMDEARQEGRQEGQKEGFQDGALVGRIQLSQELLGLPPTPSAELQALPRADLVALCESLAARLTPKGT